MEKAEKKLEEMVRKGLLTVEIRKAGNGVDVKYYSRSGPGDSAYAYAVPADGDENGVGVGVSTIVIGDYADHFSENDLPDYYTDEAVDTYGYENNPISGEDEIPGDYNIPEIDRIPSIDDDSVPF